MGRPCAEEKGRIDGKQRNGAGVKNVIWQELKGKGGKFK
jgi:hypothetical protein